VSEELRTARPGLEESRARFVIALMPVEAGSNVIARLVFGMRGHSNRRYICQAI
jgi:hypothetical protein